MESGWLSFAPISPDLFPAGQITEAEDEGFANRIMHGGAFALGSYQTGLAQDAEVLGGVGLLETAGTVDVAHAAGSAAQALQDAQSGGVGKRGKEGGHAAQLARVDLGHGSISLYIITKW
jgi:hypothetical protein